MYVRVSSKNLAVSMKSNFCLFFSSSVFYWWALPTWFLVYAEFFMAATPIIPRHWVWIRGRLRHRHRRLHHRHHHHQLQLSPRSIALPHRHRLGNFQFQYFTTMLSLIFTIRSTGAEKGGSEIWAFPDYSENTYTFARPHLLDFFLQQETL